MLAVFLQTYDFKLAMDPNDVKESQGLTMSIQTGLPVLFLVGNRERKRKRREEEKRGREERKKREKREENLEAKLMLAVFLQTYDFKLAMDPNDVKESQGLTMSIQTGLPVFVSRRQ